MAKIIEYVSHPTLCGQIVAQFAFMKAMSRPEDKNFLLLQELSLDDIFSKADNYFIGFTSFEEIIDASKCNLSSKIKSFLKEWQSITDVTAIYQNIHNTINDLSIENGN